MSISTSKSGASKGIVAYCESSEGKRYREMLRATNDIPEVGAYMFNSNLAISESISRVVQISRELTDKPLIFSVQAGKPNESKDLANACSEAAIDAVMLRPTTGVHSEGCFISELRAKNLNIIIDCTTHPSASSYFSPEGDNSNPLRELYNNAVAWGITDFAIMSGKNSYMSDAVERLESRTFYKKPKYYVYGLEIEKGKIVEFSNTTSINDWLLVVSDSKVGLDIRNAVNECVVAMSGLVMP